MARAGDGDGDADGDERGGAQAIAWPSETTLSTREANAVLHTLDSFASHLQARDRLDEKRRQRELVAKLRAEREHADRAEQQRRSDAQRRLRLRTQARTTRNPLSLQRHADPGMDGMDGDEGGGMEADDLVEVVFGSDMDGLGYGGGGSRRWCGSGWRGGSGCARALVGWLAYACNIAGAWVCGCGGVRSENGALARRRQ